MKRTIAPVGLATMSILAIGLLLGLLTIVDPSFGRDVQAQGEEVRLGQMRLVDGTSGPASSFELELKGMAAAGEGMHYELWMQADAGELLRLGAFVVDEGSVEFAGSSETNLLAEYNRVLISLEADDETDVITPTQVILTSSSAQ